MPRPYPAVSIPGPGGDRILPVLPVLRELLPRGGLTRGSVLAVAEFGLHIPFDVPAGNRPGAVSALRAVKG